MWEGLRLGPNVGKAAEEWIESPRLFATVAQVLRIHSITDTADVSDLVQEVRIALWEHGLAEQVGSAWIVKVARNKGVDLLRARRREERTKQALLDPALPNREADLDLLFHARASALSSRLRAFYEPHYVLALSEREVAAQLGICRASVGWLDACCRRALLGEKQSAEPDPRRRLVEAIVAIPFDDRLQTIRLPSSDRAVSRPSGRGSTPACANPK